jgi:hypothetical protein
MSATRSFRILDHKVVVNGVSVSGVPYEVTLDGSAAQRNAWTAVLSLTKYHRRAMGRDVAPRAQRLRKP